MPLQIETRKEQQCLVIVVRGSFGATEDAKDVRMTVSDALARGQTLILIDLTEASKLDDFGAESLLASSFITRHRKGLLQIFGVREEFRSMLADSGTIQLLSEADSQDAAISELLDSASRDGIASKPFDILEFVREEEKNDESASGFDVGEPKPSVS